MPGWGSPVKPSTPVIFLAFSNARDGTEPHLRHLPDEYSALRDVLSGAGAEGAWQLEHHANARADDIFRGFLDPAWRDRVAVFHFGGHANGYGLLLASSRRRPEVADAGGLAAFLARQRGLKLVFLNGCSTRPQVRALLDAGVPAVIATAGAIDDAVATEFAKRVYERLASGDALQTAFDLAVRMTQTTRGGSPRELLIDGAASDLEGGWPWGLFAANDDALGWSLVPRPQPRVGRQDVFLSYHEGDRAQVEALAERLSEAGVSFWFAPWHSVPGEPLQEQMEDALGRAEACAVIVGEGERLVGWHNEQLRVAIQTRVEDDARYRVIPVLLPGAGLPGARDLPRFLRRYELVTFRDAEDADAFRRLMAGVLGVTPVRAEEYLRARRSSATERDPPAENG